MNGRNEPLSPWEWIQSVAAPPIENRRLEEIFVTTFSTPPGRAALAHLREVFLERRIAPDRSDAELRHHEGSRSAIAYIERLASPRDEQAEDAESHSGDRT